MGGGCDDNDAFARVYNNSLEHELLLYTSALLTCCLFLSILFYELSLDANSA